jgi:diguanylate cyclase (GGDEF)-like protein
MLVVFPLAMLVCVATAQRPPGQHPPSQTIKDAEHPKPLRTFTNLREAHSLSAVEARRGYPVHVHAVVTYYDTGVDFRRIALFLHDATGGMYAAVPLGFVRSGQAPFPGTQVDVTGVTAPGDFAPIIDQARIQVIGNSHIPVHAKPVTLSHLLTGTEDGQWVEIEGVVRSVFESATNVTLEVAIADGTIGATTGKQAGVDYSHLVDSTVRIHGNAAPMFNSVSQMTGVRLFFPGLQAVTVVEPGPRDVFGLPASSISDLSRFTPTTAWLHRVHVRGTVTLHWPGKTLCIEDDIQELCAQTGQMTALAVGSRADLAGFSTLGGFKPFLSDATFQPLPGRETVVPASVTADQAMQGTYDSKLVQLQGRLIGRDLASSDTVLLLLSENFVFRVTLPAALADSRLSSIPLGSELRIVGICSTQVDPHGSLEGYGATQASRFLILLRSSQDVVVLQTPSWWTTGRILLMLVFSLAVTASVFGWVFVLKRRVEQRTCELQESKERYRHMAHHDALTGLPTRILLHDRLQIAIQRAARFKNSLALLMLDLDRFKLINDSFGHDGGDHILRVTAERLTGVIRNTDSVARMGGDEFIVLLSDLTDPEQAKEIAAKIVAALSEPVPIGGIQVPVSVSVGVCTISDGAEDADVLLKRVDAAMYRAKARGRSCFQVFTDDMIGSSQNQMQLQAALRHALEREEFELHYQPIVECETGELRGFEALLRWRHKELGLIMPGDFIDLAEESGLIVPIGEWVMREACRQIGLLERQLDRRFNLSVNLSPIQFLQENLPQVVERVLAESGRPPAFLHLEITESNLMRNSHETSSALDHIRALGVQLVLDDFGIGFSTLSYITQFPLDWIKIDKSLVRNCTTDRFSLAVIRAILEMARGVGIRIVAEGIELYEQAVLLRAEGCHAIQGHYISRPVSLAELPNLVASLGNLRETHYAIGAPTIGRIGGISGEC